jgi:hypothetical protein
MGKGENISKYLLAAFNAASYTKNPEKYETAEWRKYYTSDELLHKKYGYYGVAFINEQTKQLVIASSGTTLDFSDIKDFYEDIVAFWQIYMGYVPDQFTKAAAKFVDEIIAMLGGSAGEYEYVMTGHSIGAILANLVNVKLYVEHYEAISINFESIGSKAVLNQYLKSIGQQIDLGGLQVQTYNAPKNLLNQIHEEVGEMYEFHTNYQGQGVFPAIDEALHNHYFKTIMYEAIDPLTGEFRCLDCINE